mgnify:CR=1 FL=1
MDVKRLIRKSAPIALSVLSCAGVIGCIIEFMYMPEPPEYWD